MPAAPGKSVGIAMGAQNCFISTFLTGGKGGLPGLLVFSLALRRGLASCCPMNSCGVQRLPGLGRQDLHWLSRMSKALGAESTGQGVLGEGRGKSGLSKSLNSERSEG